MKTMITGKNFLIDEELLNDLYAKGYRYYCDGDYRTLGTTDPWSGMPDTDNNTYFFDTEDECKAFAEKQLWVFNHDIHATVHKLPKHTETYAERKVRLQKEYEAKQAKKAAAAARKKAKEAKAAADAGMTVEEYRAYLAKQEDIKRTNLRIEELEKELAEAKKYLAKLTA